MIVHPESGIPIVSLRRIRESVGRLQAILLSRKLVIDPASELAQTIALGKSIEEPSTRVLLNDPNDRLVKARILGIMYLACVIAEAAHTPSFEAIGPELKYLVDKTAKPIMMAASEKNPPRDHIFEIEIACLMAAMGANVKMVEPDVVADFGERWDVACKMSYSEKTFCDQIEKGIQHALKQPGDRGLVVVGLSSRLDHDALLPIASGDEAAWPRMKMIERQLKREIRRARAILRFNRGVRFIHGGTNEKFRGIYLMLHGITMLEGIPAIVTVGAFVGRDELYGDKNVLEE
jgi:hypothetical protein